MQPDSLRLFAPQQHDIISRDFRSIILILSRRGMLPSCRFLVNVLQREAAALDALLLWRVDALDAGCAGGLLHPRAPHRQGRFHGLCTRAEASAAAQRSYRYHPPHFIAHAARSEENRGEIAEICVVDVMWWRLQALTG